MLERYLKYYHSGFNLVNKNLLVLIIGLVLTFGSGLNMVIFSYFSSSLSTLWPIYVISSIVLSILSIGYLFVPPIAFNSYLEGERVTLKMVLLAMKKMFFKSLLLALVITGASMIWFTLVSPPSRPLLTRELGMYFSLILPIISPLGLFFGIFFAIKNQPFIASVKNSLAVAIKHLPFVYLTLPFNLLNWSMTSLLHSTALYVYQAFTLYFALIISAAVVLYYRDLKL